MPKRRRTSVDRVSGSSPSIWIVPLVGVSSVVSILIVVVLPAPFGPRKAKISPALTSSEMSLTANTSPYFLTRFAIRIMGADAIESSRGLPLRFTESNREVIMARDKRLSELARSLHRASERLWIRVADPGKYEISQADIEK